MKPESTRWDGARPVAGGDVDAELTAGKSTELTINPPPPPLPRHRKQLDRVACNKQLPELGRATLMDSVGIKIGCPYVT